MAKKKKQFARERASQLLAQNTMTLGPEGRTYQLHDRESGELNVDPLIGVDVDAGLLSRNRRQNKLIGKELMRQRALLPRDQAIKEAEKAKTSSSFPFVPSQLPEFKFDPTSYRGITLGQSTQATETSTPTAPETPAGQTTVTSQTTGTQTQQPAAKPESTTTTATTKSRIGDIDLNSGLREVSVEDVTSPSGSKNILIPNGVRELAPITEKDINIDNYNIMGYDVYNDADGARYIAQRAWEKTGQGRHKMNTPELIKWYIQNNPDKVTKLAPKRQEAIQKYKDREIQKQNSKSGWDGFWNEMFSSPIGGR